MDKRKVITILVISMLGLAALGAYAVHTVNAQAPTPTPSTSNPAAPQGNASEGRGMQRGMKGGWEANEEDLAAALGITVEKLQAAEKTAQDEALKQAVSQGLITQQQADRLAERGLPGFHFGGKGMMDNGIDYNALLAKALNISVEDLRSAQSKAFVTAVDRAVQEGSLTQEQADLLKARQALAGNENFQSSMKSAYEAAIAQAVKDGVITQAQADLILQNSQQRGFPGWGGGFDGFRGHGGRGRHGFPDGTAPTTPEQTAPEAPASSNGA